MKNNIVIVSINLNSLHIQIRDTPITLGLATHSIQENQMIKYRHYKYFNEI